MEIKEATEDQLKRELQRRKLLKKEEILTKINSQKDNPNLIRVKKICKRHLEMLIEPNEYHAGIDEYTMNRTVTHAIMEALYGKDIIDWANKMKNLDLL